MKLTPMTPYTPGDSVPRTAAYFNLPDTEKPHVAIGMQGDSTIVTRDHPCSEPRTLPEGTLFPEVPERGSVLWYAVPT